MSIKYFESYHRLTSPYGWRIHPVHKTRRFHTGIDLVKEYHGQIFAVVPGIVTWAKWGARGTGFGGYGNVVQITDKYKHNHLYCHLHSISVNEGQSVNIGDTLATQGNTGVSTADHLHFEIREGGFGTHIDPIKYLDEYFEKEEQEEVQKCSVFLDGKFIGEGVLNDGRSYLPVRALENTKYVVESWDGETKTVYLRSVQ